MRKPDTERAGERQLHDRALLYLGFPHFHSTELAPAVKNGGVYVHA